MSSNDSLARVPFNLPYVTGRELDLIQQAIANSQLSGDGPFSLKCSELLEQQLGVSRALLTPSCTHALELAALLIDLEPGDEVVVPAFTFPSTVNAFVLRGARPVFADIRADTLNLDESKLQQVTTRKTKAIVVVHYAGVACDMATIGEFAQQNRFVIIEDNAHGLFAKYRGQYLGTFGSLAALSFHETKNFSCGEGGALLINDADLITRAEIIREKGTNRHEFFRGEVDKYTWVDVGSSYLLSDILAAFLCAQLEARVSILAKRQAIWSCYYNGLTGWADANGVRLPFVPADCEPSNHMFHLVMPTAADRDALIRHLANFRIAAIFHYQPLHLSRMGRSFGGKTGDCPVTENVADCLLRLPFYNDLTESDLARVVEAITEFTTRGSR